MSYQNIVANTAGTTAQSTRANSINVVASGTWGSGTLSVQIQDPESGSWATVYSNTANFAVNLILGSGVSYRYVLAGATSPDLDIYAVNAYMKDMNL